MTPPRFLQIHTLQSYTAALINRDDTGLSKRLPYGDAVRTRISSQCLKRHWRLADDPHALNRIDGAVQSFRSRQLVTELVIAPLKSRYSEEVVAALEPEFQRAVYGEKGDKGKQSRQTLLFGAPELAWLATEAEKLAASANNKVELQAAAGEWAKAFKANIKAMRDATALPGGLTSALFGRMVTSDPEANIDAPVHVAHAFTVHPEQAEGDYFTAVDDLAKDGDIGADTIQETELTSGLFYGYVVVDMPGLIENCGQDRVLAAKVLYNLVYLIAEISPGAKLGSTAPYGRAELMLMETGDRQPRSLAGAYRQPVANSLPKAEAALVDHLAGIDRIYATGEARRYFSLAGGNIPEATAGTLSELAEWASQQLERVE